MNRYAENTSVDVERSQAELQRLLKKHGASMIATMSEDGVAAVAFQIDVHRVRLEIKVPTVRELMVQGEADKPRIQRFHWVHTTSEQKKDWAREQQDRIERQRWRALVLVCKAKLELIAEGSSTIVREFMADLILPNGQRVEQWLIPQLNNAGKKMPPLLPAAR